MSGTPYVSNAGVFLIETLFGLYLLAVMLRFLLQWARADFRNNDLLQVLVRITNPPLLPLRRYIPGYLGLDMAAVVLMLGLQILELLLIAALVGQSVTVAGLLVLAVARLLSLLLTILFWAVIIQAVLSWVNPNPYHPAVSLLYQLTEPILRPARGLLPPISGLDLSPIVVLIVLHLLQILLIAPLSDIGRGLLAGS